MPRSERVVRALLAAALLAAGACQRHEPYWVGAAGQFAGREPARENLRGIELATDEVNAAGGINGHPVRLVVRDDQGEGELAAHAAHEFVADSRVSVIVGHTASTAMLAAAPIYDGHIAAIATTATAPMLSGISSWVFRVVASDSTTGAELARFSAARGWRSAAVLYQNDVYGRGLADAFRAHFPGRIVSSDPVPADVQDLSTFGRFYQRFTPDVVFVVASRSTIPVLLRKTLADLHLHAAILASEGSMDLGPGSSRAEDIYVEAPFSAEEQDPPSERFARAFERRYGHAPSHDAALAYDGALTAFAALRAAGPDRAAIRRYLAALDEAHAPIGATGKVFFDSLGDRVGMHPVLLQVRRGRLGLLATGLR
ncbi:MAG TPA: ABC transporter substrate-binding protein [Gemmatimonadaceae bacterium]|nr:ABC transporter substrate-binding protein [Gemmatimonadaceae bacterium]